MRERDRLLPCSRLTWAIASGPGREVNLGQSCVRIEMSCYLLRCCTTVGVVVGSLGYSHFASLPYI